MFYVILSAYSFVKTSFALLCIAFFGLPISKHKPQFIANAIKYSMLFTSPRYILQYFGRFSSILCRNVFVGGVHTGSEGKGADLA